MFKIVQKRSTNTWPGLARNTVTQTELGQHAFIRVNIPSCAEWCLSLHRQRACGRQRAIRCLKVRSFRRGTNLFSSTHILDVSTRGFEFTGPINRIFDPINRCNFVHVLTDVFPFQVKWPNKMADPLNRRPNKADSTLPHRRYFLLFLST